MTVNVIRNPNAPVFDRQLYTIEISEYQDLKSEILRVVATDADGPNVSFTFISNTSILEFSSTI